ncbi:MAG TPA: GNAT family N-acetyltransferase [Candidatus Dormibacteraeota bacterium]|nr:GNAT family N-acetyltransferase [Candidatus Dormibacteraeota bacterium]
MPAVSQALVEFANHHRQRAEPGIEVIVTPRYEITLQPDFPIAGPNNVSWIRCRADEADDVIKEVRAIVAPRRLPLMWTLDPESKPADLAHRLHAHDIDPDRHGVESKVMVLSSAATIHVPRVAGLEIVDALADPEAFQQADRAAAEAFRAESLGDDGPRVAAREHRRRNLLAAGHRHLLLARVDGEPAGSGSLGLYPPDGAKMNGGSVRSKFRGRGVYRALVAARVEIARRAGVAGLTVWGGDMSRPILERLGFEVVGWRRFYVDTITAD